jgi:hypothetical protein
MFEGRYIKETWLPNGVRDFERRSGAIRVEVGH